MAIILALETSTKNCSVAIADKGLLLASVQESSDQYIHSEKLHLFIDKAIKDSGLSFSAIDAVAVGKGPGSYTGLRIGVSAAKGLCYALQIPLIALNSLEVLAGQFAETEKPLSGEVVIPMIDARRMEVYTAVFDHKGNPLSETEARIIERNSFEAWKAERIHVIGDGALKTGEVLNEDRFIHYNTFLFPEAQVLARLAESRFYKKEFVDVAYFEPFYLKDFIAGKPRRAL